VIPVCTAVLLLGSAALSAGSSGAPPELGGSLETTETSRPGDSPAGWLGPPCWECCGEQSAARFGDSLAGAGDVDGDGLCDVVIGAPRHDGAAPDAGGVFLFRGADGGLASRPFWTYLGKQPDGLAGYSVSFAGDVDGNGCGDVVIGAPAIAALPARPGEACLFGGSSVGLDPDPAWHAVGERAGDLFGESVAGAGDVDGDGWDDLLVGAPGWTGREALQGRVYLFRGSRTGPAAVAGWTHDGPGPGAGFGGAVASAGDVNGDGFDDVVVGAADASLAQPHEGAAYLFLGSSTGLLERPAWFDRGGQGYAYFGYSVAAAGDVNGDGFSDVLIGAFGYGRDPGGQGRALLYLGSPHGLQPNPAWTVAGDQASANLGISLSTAGDLDGDGRDDVLIGSPGWDGDEADAGRVLVFLGDRNGLSPRPIRILQGDARGSFFGAAVCGAGDVDGDGWPDVLIGAPYRSGDLPGEGCAFLFRGGSLVGGSRAWAFGRPALASPEASPRLVCIPNPWRGQLQIAFRLSVPGRVRIEVVDSQGRRVGRVLDSELPAGDHRVLWQGDLSSATTLGPGVYWVRMIGSGGVGAARIVRVR
jgi:hypothetical protein